MVLSPLKSGLELRLEVLDTLAAAQRLQQLPRQQRATIQIALELCGGGDGATPKPHSTAAAAAWLPRLHLAAAEADAAAGDLPAAKGHAAAAVSAAQQGGQLQAQVCSGVRHSMLLCWV
jgi:hypothetical protein